MWPDWSGNVAAIIASGPSVKQADLSALKGRAKVMAIKENVDLCSWADVVYGCDQAWWQHRRELPEFKGLKVSWAGNRVSSQDVRRVEIKPSSNELVLDDPCRVGAGGNSGFQCLNLALHFKARRILLIGFDVHGRGGEHWYGRNTWAMANNPTEDNYRRWRAAFSGAAKTLTEMGVDVVNASPVSDLKCFRRAPIDDALAGWNV